MPRDSQKALTWIPVLGDFEFKGDHIKYLGKWLPTSQPSDTPDPLPNAAFGLAMSDVALSDGVIEAEIEFETVNSATMCELAVAYDTNARHLLSAGLGGEPPIMFGIREFRGPRRADGWWDHEIGGTRSSLKAGTKHRVRMELRGALVSLRIDNVPVASATVPGAGATPRQVGLICRSESNIVIRHFRTESAKPKAFVVMQFGDQYDDVYHHVVKEVMHAFDVNILRADEVAGPGLIIADIVKEIAASQLIVADITPVNPNVYFEIGYALALRKPTILLARKGTPLPFDVQGFRVLFYEDSIGGKGRLMEGLKRHLAAILSPPSP